MTGLSGEIAFVDISLTGISQMCDDDGMSNNKEYETVGVTLARVEKLISNFE